jgi:hypothetical protein
MMVIMLIKSGIKMVLPVGERNIVLNERDTN